MLLAPHIEFAPIPIETVAAHIDNQTIPQLLRTVKKIDGRLVEGGEGGFYFGHLIIKRTDYLKKLRLIDRVHQ